MWKVPGGLSKALASWIWPCSMLSGMHPERCSVSRLANSIPLDNLDSFIQSLRCLKILQRSRSSGAVSLISARMVA
jgi:hypothetical protein